MSYYGYAMRCDLCGRFMKPEPGASWVCVPATDIPGEYGDERDRCKTCTELYGMATCNPKYRADMCQGTYLIPPPAPVPLPLECILTDEDTEQENADVD